MFLLIEGDRLINLDQVKIVELNHSRKTASVLMGMGTAAHDSYVLYRYYSKLELEDAPPEEKEPNTEG